MRDAPKLSNTENRPTMTALAAQDAFLPDAFPSEVLSPELVLVSSPEVAQFARSLLSIPSLSPAPSYIPAGRDMQPGQAELTMVWLVCIAMTLGPLLFILIVRP
jgi:hypothetical protein